MATRKRDPTPFLSRGLKDEIDSMAGYREHVSVSSFLGIGYGVAATFVFGVTPVQGALAACLTGIAGMLPDLDSQSGRPIREVFGLLAAIAPMVMMQRLLQWAQSPEAVMLASVSLYATIRYGGALILGKLAVHRGMFHSVPALLIAALLVFLGYKSDEMSVKLLMAGGAACGFLSHLILDELYSVEWTGIRLKLNQAAGSALKFFGKSLAANAVTYGLLFFLAYVALVDAGMLQRPNFQHAPAMLRQATESAAEHQ